MTRPPAEPLPPGATFQAYTIFDHPKDHIDNYVVRRFINASPWQREFGIEVHPGVYACPAIELFNTLEDARESIPAGCVKSEVLEPNPWIIEVWI